MTYTQAQIDRANAANLEDFLRVQGETLVRSGKEYRWKNPRQPDRVRKQMVPAQPEQGRLSGGFCDGVLRQVLP